MTEEEWLTADDPELMLDFLRGHTWASERQMRLFVVACARDCLAYNPAYNPEAAARAAEFEAATYRVEAFADGEGALTDSDTWVECSEVLASAYAVVWVDFENDQKLRQPLEALKDYRVNPLHWLRDIFGPEPFKEIAAVRPKILASNQNAGARLAAGVYEDRKLPEGTLDPVRLAVLADALEDAGCTDSELLGHLRAPGPHVRGCWALDLALGKS
jgi:hypothetical protein